MLAIEQISDRNLLMFILPNDESFAFLKNDLNPLRAFEAK
jgi:hypothetical protein